MSLSFDSLIKRLEWTVTLINGHDLEVATAAPSYVLTYC